MLDLSRPLAPADFHTVEVLILSGQLHPFRIGELVRDNPEFSRWYEARAAVRHGRQPNSEVA
jgi:hypothetical protein